MRISAIHRTLAVCGLALALSGMRAGAADTAKSGHRTAHGGGLNVIEECETGHAEVVLDGANLRVWLVGGDGATETAVRVGAKSIPMLFLVDGEDAIILSLSESPLALAEEAPGDCSHFTASAPWLDGIESFTAVGVVRFKGQARVLRINYPEPYDPDDK